jgi:TIR domain
MDDQKKDSTAKRVSVDDNAAIVVEENVSGSVQINRIDKIEYHYHLEQAELEEKLQQDINARKKRKKKWAEPRLNIFISYARSDVEIVQGIYESLVDEQYHPWMDIYSIKGGENWLRAITKGIDECEIFLAILSKNSVSRRGVIQKELKKALDKWEEMLPDDIYIIPVRIDDCPIPDLLKHLQVLDWDSAKGTNKLLEAIRVGLARRKTIG